MNSKTTSKSNKDSGTEDIVEEIKDDIQEGEGAIKKQDSTPKDDLGKEEESKDIQEELAAAIEEEVKR